MLVANELVQIPRQSYLTDVAEPSDAAYHAKLGAAEAERTIQGYVAQLIMVALAVLASLLLSRVGASILITVLSGTWFLAAHGYVVRLFPPRPASRTRDGRGTCALAYAQLGADLWELRSKHPEALKFLVFLFVVQNGLGATMLTIATTYLTDQLRFTGPMTSLMYATVLVAGVPWLMVFKKVVRRLRYKTILALIVLLWIVGILTIGLGYTSDIGGHAGGHTLCRSGSGEAGLMAAGTFSVGSRRASSPSSSSPR